MKEVLMIILPIGISFAFILGGFLCELAAKSKTEQMLIRVAKGVEKQLSELKNPPSFVDKDRDKFTMKDKWQASRLLRKWRRRSIEQESGDFLKKELYALLILYGLALSFCTWVAFEALGVSVLLIIMLSMIVAGAVTRRRQCCLRIPKAFSEAIKPGWALLKELGLYQTEIKADGKSPVTVNTDMSQEDLAYILNEERGYRLAVIAEYIARGGELFLDDDFMW